MSKDLSVVIKGEVSVYEREANTLDIKSAPDLEHAVRILSETNKTADRVKAEKERITKPLNDALKVERARWKPIEDACANAVATIKTKMLAYQRVIEAANAIKEQKIIARVERGTLRADTAVAKIEALPDATASVKTDVGMMQFRTIQKLVIDDALLVPREYLVVDDVAVKNAIKQGKSVPGCRVVEEKTIANFR
jgi:hypothetical protein